MPSRTILNTRFLVLRDQKKTRRARGSTYRRNSGGPQMKLLDEKGILSAYIRAMVLFEVAAAPS
jgi:hypothetical protein